ncbi:hypothetical protein D3C84_746410 [compost metagenome]
MFRADVARLRVSPDQVKRPGAVLALRQRWPWLGGVFDGQPGTCALGVEQRCGRKFGGKAVQRHGLQVVVGLDVGQQRGQRHGAVGHVTLVGHVIADADGLHLRVLEQLLGLPRATGRAQLQIQLCGMKRRAEQQGPEHNERFQMIAIHVVQVPQRLAQQCWPGKRASHIFTWR